MKKILALALVVVMLFSFAACGGTDDDATTSAAGDTTTDAAYKIGGIGPLTGDTAIYGTAVKNGAQIAVDEINEKGDIKIELNFQDDEGDAEKAVNAYNSLKDWGMQVLLGTVTTTPCIAVAAETYADRVFEITPSASSADVTEGKDNVFQICFTDPNQGVASAQAIAENKLGTKVAVIYQSDDAYSAGILAGFKTETEAAGLEVVYEGAFTTDTKTDFSAQINGAKEAGAEVLYLPIYYTEASLIFNQAAAADFAPKFFGVDGMDGILTLEGFDTALAEGVYLLSPFSADAEDDATKSFVTKYQEAYGETPNQFAADAYDAVYIYAQNFAAAEITPDMDAETVCEAMIPAMLELSYDGLTGTAMTWSEKGEVSKAPIAFVIEDGKYVK